MKITLCGSIKFADKLVDAYQKLEKLGHQPMMHEDMFGVADGTAKELEDIRNNVEHSELKRKYGYIKWWYDSIRNIDSILVLNYDKNGIKNYIGGNTLIEIGFAHVSNKKVFLLNPIPEKAPYVDEIKAMADVILKGDLSKIQ